MIEQKKNPAGILLTIILIAALLTVCLELGLSYLRPNTTGSISKHLIHFAIVFSLFGGTSLLCLFCSPFKKLWIWLNQHVLSIETRPIAIDIIYALLAGLMLLHHFYVLLYYPTIPAGATKFAPFWIILAALTIVVGKFWQNISFQLAAVFLVFTFERLYAKNLILTGNDIVYISSAIYAMFICLGIFQTLRPSIRKSFLKIFCALWTLATLALCAAGLYTFWTGIRIPNLAGELIKGAWGRLWIFSYPTITATFTCCGGIMALIGFVISKNKMAKIFYLLVCFIAVVANSLTDARASFIVLAFMIAGTISLGFWTLYRNKISINTSWKKSVLLIVGLIICFSVCFYCAVEGQRLIAVRFVELRDNGGFLPIANAEDQVPQTIVTPPPPYLQQRDVWISYDSEIDGALNGRYQIWQKGIQYITMHPDTLFLGLSVDGSVASAIEREDHTHNILLQTLLEGGIPSLLLFLSLILYSIFHTIRLWNQRGLSLWQRILPLPVLSILLLDMVECLSHFSYGHPPMTIFWFFLGATITVGKSIGKTSTP